MTESEWLACSDPLLMLEFLRDRASDRKLRLFACACCRVNVWELLPDERCKKVVETAELLADGLSDLNELAYAKKDAWAAHKDNLRTASWQLQRASAAACQTGEGLAIHLMAREVVSLVADLQREEGPFRGLYGWVESVSLPFVASIFRHIMGNPFRPHASPEHWPLAVVRLADALYNGETCSFALHDALLEGGYPDLAEHFRESYHPKGCWVLDAILGKETARGRMP